MPTPLENLQTLYANALARLVELDSVAVIDKAKMTYSVAGRTIGWNEYRASLKAEVDGYAAQIEGQLKAQQMAAGPFTVYGPAGC